MDFRPSLELGDEIFNDGWVPLLSTYSDGFGQFRDGICSVAKDQVFLNPSQNLGTDFGIRL